MRRLWIVVLAGLIVAAGAQLYLRRWLPAPPVQVASTAAAQPPDVALITDSDIDAVSEQLGEMKPGITVETWRLLHQEDRGQASPWYQMACATFQWSKPLADGSTLKRTAAFYPPDPPKPLELPANEDSARLVSRCTLGAVRVELEVDNRDRLLRSVPKIQAAFTARLGNPDPKLATHGLPLGAAWRAGEVTVMIQKNLDVNPQYSSSALPRGQPRPTLLTAAYLPKLQEEMQEAPGEQYEAVGPETSPEIFQLAMRIAAVEQADLVKAMSELYQDCYAHPLLSGTDAFYQQKRTTPALERGKKVVDALEQWLQITRELPPQRKAAGLLAAYFLLKSSTARPGDDEMDAMRDWLLDKKIIATGDELTPWGPTARWPKEARDLDPEGPIGDAVTLMAMTNPGQMRELIPVEYQPMKKLPDGNTIPYPVAESSGQKDVTDFVIETGEKYLSHPRDPETTERVEYFIASAYSDQMMIPTIDPDDKPSDWALQRAEAAKPEAVKHFAAAMVSNSQQSVSAWRAAWRVLAGLPLAIRFYDIGD